jgi:putrescine transport system permease protein
MVTAPLVVPEVIGAISTLLLFVDMKDLIGWPTARGALALAIAHAAYTLSYVAVVVQSRLADMDRSVEEAAQDLGAPPWKVFFVITLPIISPALLSGWLLAFSLSLDDVVTSAFVAGPGATTLPLLIFSSVKLGVNPEINAIGTIIVAVVATATIVSGIWVSRAERARMRSVNKFREEELTALTPIAAE